MLKKTIEISTFGTKLSVEHRQLVVERPDQDTVRVPIEDLGVLVIDDPTATYTQAVVVECLMAGVAITVTDAKHLPVGMMLPLDLHHVSTQRHIAQVAIGVPLKKRLWQAIVKRKIRQQGLVLREATGSDEGLISMSSRVTSGDKENLEAQAAQRYWLALFGPDFVRERGSAGINGVLNYGYAVIRAAVARSIVASGMLPSLGVFHKGRGNPFCLADDLMEPYRPFVDRIVYALSNAYALEELTLNDRSIRAKMLSILGQTIEVGERRLPMLLAIGSSASSLAKSITESAVHLQLPDGLPVGDGSEDRDE